MLQVCVFLSVSLFSFFAINYVSSETVQGSVLLNSGVFDKVISCAGAPSCRLDVIYKVFKSSSNMVILSNILISVC